MPISRWSRRRALVIAALVIAALASCRDERAPSRPRWPSRSDACAVPAVPRQDWRHTASALATRLGDPGHVADDVIVPAGVAPTVTGKFVYGAVSKDLEDERVTLVVDDAGCPRSAGVTALTDDDGQIALAGPRLSPGHHPYALVVNGDGSAAVGGVWVGAAGRSIPAVVFDIDGTITTDDGELFEDLLGGTAALHPGARDVAQRWHDLGYLVIYVTGRPYPLRARTRAWLDRNQLPLGPLYTTPHLRQALPTRAQVGAFKRDTVRALLAGGVQIVRAYGNAGTDACAYAEAGLAADAIFVLGAPPPCPGYPPPQPLADYRTHLADVERQPRAP